MGRFVKNYALHTGSHAIKLPDGSNTLGPQYPENGQIKFNVDLQRLEVYYSGAWNEIASSSTGRVAIVKDYVAAWDGSSLTLTMSQSYAPGEEAMILVFVGNVFQNPGVAYTVNGTAITFQSAPMGIVPVVILHNFNSIRA